MLGVESNRTFTSTAVRNFSSYFFDWEPFAAYYEEFSVAYPTPSFNNNDFFTIENRFSDNSSVIYTPIFTDSTLAIILAYCGLFLIGAIGNSTVFITLFRSRRRKSRISLMMSHLAVADLIVTFVMIPLEIGWRITVEWIAGNAACKMFLFLRAFGLYLSSNVLICISLDRYFAVMHPLKVTDARRRGRSMLISAWITSFICSIPQSFVFHVSQHPQTPEFEQCVSFGFFANEAQEVAYNLFCVSAMYFVPLIIITVAYTCILCKITSKSTGTRDLKYRATSSRVQLRRSDIRNIERARSRTLRMTITIVSVFAWCWMPYTVMTLWYMFDRESAVLVDPRLQDLFFIMAVSNSCMNPLVYGSYTMNLRRECGRCCYCLPTRKLTVASATTRRTGPCYNIRRNVNTSKGSIRKHVRIRERPDCAGKISKATNLDLTACSVSFHSDPYPQIDDANRNAENLSRTLADQGLLTTRSLDSSMFVGYRRQGHQRRWRTDWTISTLPVDSDSCHPDLDSGSRFSSDCNGALCSTVKKNDFFNSVTTFNEHRRRVNSPSVPSDSNDPCKRTATRVHFADPITELQSKRRKGATKRFSPSSYRFPHASEDIQDYTDSDNIRHTMYGRNDTPV